MEYDFDQVIDRTVAASVKWQRYKKGCFRSGLQTWICLPGTGH
jgi:hypothetical protein